ncbi:MAG: hypothetical protein A2X94_15765 [Bdellovibrionales bacterium GWB1_55_8]|nr:MAG: hypothetical protein A2X94_15765 [Bdellovibrionales bacterium GWB1_55_8]
MYLLLVLFSAFSIQVQAEPIQSLFEKLRDSGEDYQNEGAVCEQVARLELQREYPSHSYEIVVGIEYANVRQTIGELDVVVFDRHGQAILVGEVKCWSDLRKARRKAAQQRTRFLDTIQSGAPIDMFLASNRSVPFRREQFQALSRFISISQRGGRSFGFDRDLPNSLSEMRELRETLMQCQAAGKCRRP